MDSDWESTWRNPPTVSVKKFVKTSRDFSTRIIGPLVKFHEKAHSSVLWKSSRKIHRIRKILFSGYFLSGGFSFSGTRKIIHQKSESTKKFGEFRNTPKGKQAQYALRVEFLQSTAADSVYHSRFSLPQQIQSITADSVYHSRFSIPQQIQSITADSVYHNRFSLSRRIQSTTAVT